MFSSFAVLMCATVDGVTDHIIGVGDGGEEGTCPP